LSGKKETGQLGGKYEAILPTEYYEAKLLDNVKMEEKLWFLRPHHIESLTEHPRSIKDNLLETKFISKI